ncbi:MAG: hypothetical protein WCK89_11435, partial [bacterium]
RKIPARPKLHPGIIRPLDPLERRSMSTGCLRNFLRHYFFPPFFPTLTSTIVIVSFPKISTTFTAILRRPGVHS